MNNLFNKFLTSLLLVQGIVGCLYAQPAWQTIMDAEVNYHYFLGNQAPPVDWKELDFDDSNWPQGQGGIGYGDNDDNTTISNVVSLYMRHEFQVSDLEELTSMILYADYDDGFVAYINGQEVTRSNIQGAPPAYNTEADELHEAVLYSGGVPESFQLPNFKDYLVEGANVFAVQTHNFDGLASSDLTSLYWLLGLSDPENPLYGDTPSWFQSPFFNTSLPIISINTGGQIIPDEPSINANMSIIDYSGGNTILDTPNDFVGNIAIEKRGQSSQFFFPKNNYAVELKDEFGEDMDASLLGMPEEEDWVLHGPYSDKTLMRNTLAMELARSIGQYAVRTQWVDLFVNNQYEGVYVLMEKIKRGKDRVDIADLDPDEITGDDLTGGYIIKLDKGDADWESMFDVVFNPGNKLRFQYVYPRRSKIVAEQAEYIQSYVDSMELALRSSDLFYEGKRYDEYLDLPSFVDHFLLKELARDVDAYRFSSYYYKDKDSKGGLLKAGPVWDFNIAFGNADYCNGYQTWGWIYDEHCDTFNPFWWGKMFNDPAFVNLANCRWKELRAGPLSKEVIFAYIDESAALLAEPAARNFARWPILNEDVWPNYQFGGTYQDEINYLKDFISDRIDWMDEYMKGTCLTSTENPDIQGKEMTIYPNPVQEKIQLSTSKASFNYKIFGQDGRLHQQGEVDGGIPINVQDLADGLYFVSLTTANSAYHFKFIKN